MTASTPNSLRLRARKSRPSVLKTRAVTNLSLLPVDCHPTQPATDGPGRHPEPGHRPDRLGSSLADTSGISTSPTSQHTTSPASTPSPPTVTPSSPADDEQLQLELEATDAMLNPASVRGRNEDLDDLEEKGLLIGGEGSSLELESGGTTPRRRAKGESGHYEKLDLGVKEESGLKSKRDQQAFALLIVLWHPPGPDVRHAPVLTQGAPVLLKAGRVRAFNVAVQSQASMVADSRRHLRSEMGPAQILDRAGAGAPATQDIAVDGWALTLLSPPNLSYASTAQTIGLGIGSALAFTVFLALNSVDFANRYFRSVPADVPLVTLGPYMKFWGLIYLVVTVWLVFFKTEDPVSATDPDLDVKKVYRVMWSIVSLKNIQSFLFILLIAKFGFQVNESVTQLKLLEKGLSREDLAVASLLDFPAQMIVGWLAAKWSRPSQSNNEHRHPLSAQQTRQAAATGVLKVWVGAFWARLAMAFIAACVVWLYPSSGQVGSGYFSLVIATILMTSVTNTIQFVGITAFHTQIADPLIGGTYMTLLNTVSNLGGTWPKPIILRLVDLLTVSACSITGAECTTEAGKEACSVSKGTCNIKRDGYFVMTFACMSVSALLLLYHILPTIKKLMALPMSAWRVKIPA
ncbi:hypothetical protein A1Q1_03040 [Trichosporon asahii var. asahii CBS 2479]|uniref:Acetyl-CoA transporter n=1 Tax=Trichosporon asahii var. asahii (strain ATCC 90039 / CBS 2479 / JCM 2466 / KCTC 7840 / NBRC 103889/ NCYC 2677 / UAMH 7654) TaxID=1186058 RepID=J6EYU3_TRIAS|nr:hypothetical protein A1Q1_03040 [Trichosporon asahii var. asahii CBS 2479]EJT48002.1 hypothetical protein A1Q1_03040 [Trichosporon asahii var. asahii CBS 2479]